MAKYVIEEDLDGGRWVGTLSTPFVRAWFLMLLLGILSHQFHVPAFAISYWQAFVVSLIILVVQRTNISRWKIDLK